MKIKRFDNLWLMGLILSASILGFVYLLKLIAPQFVVEVAQIDSIVSIGRYIDTHKWAWYLASTLFSILTYYFYCGACCGKKILCTKDWIIILVSILIGYVVKELVPSYYNTLNYVSLIVVPYLMKGKFFNTMVSFSTVTLLQVLTSEIRGIATLISNFNYATFIILMIDVYIFQILLYFAFNFNKKEQ